MNWITLSETEMILCYNFNKRVYARIYQEHFSNHVLYIVAEPSGTRTNMVFMDVEKAKRSAESVLVSFDLQYHFYTRLPL